MCIIVKGDGLVRGIAGKTNKFTIEVKQKPVIGLSVAFEGPTKTEVNLVISQEGIVEVEYEPIAGGEHIIYIKYDGVDIPNSPFKCMVIGDEETHRKLIEKIKVVGPNLSQGKVGLENVITIQSKEAGVTGGIKCVLTGPAKADVYSTKDTNENIVFIYKPSMCGQYKCQMTFNDIDLIGSPYTINVSK